MNAGIQEEYFDYTGKDSEKTKEINHDVLYRAGETANVKKKNTFFLFYIMDIKIESNRAL